MTLPKSQVPNELWGEIFENVSQYDKSTLESISLTCRAFCNISRPRFFSELYFVPYFTGDKGSVLLPSPAEVERRIERLNFLSSTRIAPLVRLCHILSDAPYGPRENWSFSTDTPYLLLDMLFERLPCFTGLQRLHMLCIALTQTRVNNLFRLPRLSQLHIMTCTVMPADSIALPPQALQVSDFQVCHDPELDHGEDYWIPLLHPEYLRVLWTAFEPRFMHILHTIPSFPNVHTLTAIVHSTTPSQNLTILSKFPGVRIFKLSGNGLNTEAVAVRGAAVFPHLEEYYGPYQALPLFLASTVTRIQTECPHPEQLLILLQGIQGHKITSFNATFKKFGSISFNEIVKLLPQLTELLLTITVSDTSRLFKREIYDLEELAKDEVVDGRFGDTIRSGFTISNFFINLAKAPFLPPNLERLAISWEYHEQFYDKLSAYKLPDFPQMRDAFREKCPGLTWLWFNGIYFMYEWRDRMPDGTVKEYIGKNYINAYRKKGRAEIFRGWKFI